MGILEIAMMAMWAAAAVLFAHYAATVASEVTYVTLADGRRQERSIPLLFKMLLPLASNFYPLIRRPFFRASVAQADALLVQGGYEGLITGEEFDKYYQKVYAKDKMNLAPEYRDGMAWVYAYFAAEDDSFYGRVDALGRDERKKRGTVADRYRIMIFRRGQKPNGKPSEMYFCKHSSDGIVSEDGSVKFEVVDIGNDESPWGWLEYTKDKSRGQEGFIRLKADTPWLEKYKIDLSSAL